MSEINVNLIFAIWMDDYSQKGSGATAIWEYWRTDDGSLRPAWHYRNVPTGTNTGHCQVFNFISILEDRGRWMQIAMHLKVSSINGKEDGVLETYCRWSDENSWTRYHYSNAELFSVPDDADYAGWRQGYFMDGPIRAGMKRHTG